MTPSRQRKSELRTKFLKQRATLDARTHASASHACSTHFKTLITTAKTVALYAPIRSEIDLLGLLDGPQRFVFPRVERDEIVFATGTQDSLQPGTFGVNEPTDAAIELSEIDFFVVPGLAFDLNGMRLGYGGGFYDRALAKLDDIPIYGAAFDLQITENLPTEAHDVPLTGWVTQTRIWTKEKK